ncbi:OLC1v1027590C1 [Oldenlandia corymbosa var. corymbosa]|uniref:OLC1v1027590C1 n=1 Tax=Oldenlandia corymbosa var. corymbosa TaxID=529605 RepID=A0AAV1CBT3_OLDCO|nr:OLC1v1027590C1 [Oldenlandia corymbosa var. corymbosa]
MNELKSLQVQISELGAQKGAEVEPLENAIEDAPISDGIMSTGEGRKQVEEKEFIDLTEDTEDSKLMELMTEIEVLNVEKKKAESDVQVWKTKCNELECRVMELERHLTSGFQEFVSSGGTELGQGKAVVGRGENNATSEPSEIGTPIGDTYTDATPLDKGKDAILRRRNLEYGGRSRKQLFFGEETNLSQKITPVTPIGTKPACRGLIDISDDEADAMELIMLNGKEREKANDSNYPNGGTTLDKNQFPSEDLTGSLDQDDEDNVICHSGITRKRRRASNIITSDSESDIDDNLPIGRLRKNSKTDGDGESVVRRRLVRLRNLKKENGTLTENSPGNLQRMKAERLCGIPTNVTSKDDESQEDDSEGERENLKDFIVSDGDLSSDDESASNGDLSSTDGSESHGESGDEAVNDINLGKIIAKLGRFKDHPKWNWEFQGDLLADLGKDPELCMKAVCALYRQQTPDEKASKATFVRNGQGLSQIDAERGTELGEFLTAGDPEGDLSKSEQESSMMGKALMGVGGWHSTLPLVPSLSAELWGLFQGLTLAWDLGKRCVVADVDSLCVVKMVNGEDDVLGLNWGLVGAIRDLFVETGCPATKNPNMYVSMKQTHNPIVSSEDEADNTPLIKLYGKRRKDVNDTMDPSENRPFPSASNDSDEDNVLCHSHITR